MRALITILILALAGAVVFQTIRFSRLAAQNQNLEAQIAELQARAAAMPDPGASVPPDALSDQERTELLRLRNQAAQLRSSTNELQQVRRQIEQLRVENQELRSRAMGSSAVATSAAAPAGVVLPRESWTFAGYATPEAALQSTLYAISKADYNTIISSLTPEEAQRMQTEMQLENKSPEEAAEKIRREAAKATSYQVLDRKEASPNEAMLLIYAGGEEKVQRVLMLKIGEEWKFAGGASRRRE